MSGFLVLRKQLLWFWFGSLSGDQQLMKFILLYICLEAYETRIVDNKTEENSIVLDLNAEVGM